MRLANGTIITIGANWAHTVLPNGLEVHAHPDECSLREARRLGYGDDVDALTRDHDPLHSMICDMLGMPYSYSLMEKAGGVIDNQSIPWVEEDAVLAVQRLKAKWDRRSK